MVYRGSEARGRLPGNIVKDVQPLAGPEKDADSCWPSTARTNLAPVIGVLSGIGDDARREKHFAAGVTGQQVRQPARIRRRAEHRGSETLIFVETTRWSRAGPRLDDRWVHVLERPPSRRLSRLALRSSR